MLARAARRPLEAFLRERLFEPLGMRDTAFSVPAAKRARFTTCYQRDAATGRLAVFDDPRSGFYARPPIFPHELVSTADDYLAFARMLLDGGGRLLSRDSVALMTADQLTPQQRAGSPFVLGPDRGWGLGLSVWDTRYGWDGGYGTSWANDPARGLIGISLTQRLFDSPSLPAVHRDFWSCADQSSTNAASRASASSQVRDTSSR